MQRVHEALIKNNVDARVGHVRQGQRVHHFKVERDEVGRLLRRAAPGHALLAHVDAEHAEFVRPPPSLRKPSRHLARAAPQIHDEALSVAAVDISQRRVDERGAARAVDVPVEDRVAALLVEGVPVADGPELVGGLGQQVPRGLGELGHFFAVRTQHSVLMRGSASCYELSDL